MADYQAPLKDMNFLLYDVFSMEALWQSMPNLSEHVDRETAQAILQECAKIAEQEIAPLSRQGDEIGVLSLPNHQKYRHDQTQYC